DPNQGDAVNIRRVALMGARRDGDLVLAREIGICRIAIKEFRGCLDDRTRVEQFLCVYSRDGTTGDIADIVSAAADCGETILGERFKDQREALELNPMQ